jgi:hypothetical protein
MSSALAPHCGGAAPSGHAGPDGLSAGLWHGKEAAMGAPQHDHDHDHTEPPSEPALRVKALELLLIEKGLVDRRRSIPSSTSMKPRIGPPNSAQVIARAWSDPAFKPWLCNLERRDRGRAGARRSGSGTDLLSPFPLRAHKGKSIPLSPLAGEGGDGGNSRGSPVDAATGTSRASRGRADWSADRAGVHDFAGCNGDVNRQLLEALRRKS